MIIKTIASSSKGNAYIISDNQFNLLIECGLPLKELKKRSNYDIPMNIHACLVSHSHNDHSRGVKELLDACVECYMLEETAKAKGVLEHHRTRIIEPNKVYVIGSYAFMPLQMVHDVHCVGFLIQSRYTGERLLFATDTCYIPNSITGLDYIMIEANHDLKLLENDTRKDRVIQTHMGIDTTIKYLNSIDISKVKEIYLMHLSSGNSNAEDFKKRVQASTGKVVIVCNE